MIPRKSNDPVLLRSAVKLVGSRRPVGKVGETHCVFPGLSIGDRACAVRRGSAQPTVHKFIALLGMASGGQCGRSHSLAEVSLVRRAPAERLMWPPQIIPVEKLGQAALLFDAVGRWPQVDPFVLHGPPQALDKDVVVAAPASIHADLDPVIPQHLGELVAGELRALIGIEDAGLAKPGERLAQRLDTAPRPSACLTAARTTPVGLPSR